jgi:TonB family protein
MHSVRTGKIVIDATDHAIIPATHMHRLASLLTLLFLSGLAVHSQSPQDYLHSLVGQKLLLRHFGEVDHAKVKAKELSHLKGACDSAILIRTASWEKNKVQIFWQGIGQPELHASGAPVCRRKMSVYPEGNLEIVGFKAHESADSVAASVRLILQTPEEYLAAAGVPLNLTPQPVEDEVKAPEQPFTSPKALLSVDPTFSEQAGKAGQGGVVKIAFYVGKDGRVYKPRVTKPAGMELDEQALRVLSLWRFQPALKQNQPIAMPILMQFGFNLYLRPDKTE